MLGAMSSEVSGESIRMRRVELSEDGEYPNNPRLPLMLYGGVVSGGAGDVAGELEALFGRNGWPPAWRDTVYEFHHYHSDAHEALGVIRGKASVQFGGPNGTVIEVKAGDVVVLPAGTAHKLIEGGRGFAVVGAYPSGQHPDLCYGKEGERPGVDERISRVPLPESDPVTGRTGGLMEAWMGSATGPAE